MNKSQREASARVKEAEAAITTYNAETDRIKAEAARAQAKLDRLRKPAVYQRGDGVTHDLTDTGAIRPNYLSATNASQAELAKLIAAGQQKIETGDSIPRAAKTVAKSLRVMTRADARTLARLDATIAKAQATRRILISEAWKRGDPLTIDEVARQAALVWTLRKSAPSYGYAQRGAPDDYRLHALESTLADARIHQRFVNGEMDAETVECPCLVCRRAKTEAATVAAREKEWTDAPRVKVWCKGCEASHVTNLRIMDIRTVDGEQRQGCPVFRCKGQLRIDEKRWDKLVALRKQAHERELAKNGLTWECTKPGCHETVTALPYETEDGWAVECPVCEMGDYVQDIKPIGRNARRWKEAAA